VKPDFVAVNNPVEDVGKDIRMVENILNGVRVAILATDGFEPIELVAPRTALDNAGAKTTLIAPMSGSIYGLRNEAPR
jgi:protease I